MYSEREIIVFGIKYMSTALGVRSVNYAVMSLEDLKRLLELLEAEYVEKFWFMKYRHKADKDWIEKQGL